MKIRTISLPEELTTVLIKIALKNRRSFSSEVCKRVEDSITPEELIEMELIKNKIGKWNV